MSFVSAHPSVLDEELTLAWRMEPGDPPFQVLAIVRHTDSTHTGVEFLNISLAERRRLLQSLVRRGRPDAAETEGAGRK